MSKLNAEIGFISKLIETKDIKVVSDYQIKTSFFTGENKRIVSYMLKHIHQFGEPPTHRVLKAKFPSIKVYTYTNDKGKKVVGTNELLSFWCNELILKTKHNNLIDLIQSTADNLESLNTEEAYEILKSGVAELDQEVTISNSVKINDNTDERKNQYLERKKNQGMLGIGTGWNALDMITKGLIDGCLITIAGRTGTGKTFFECILGTSCVLQGCSVLQMVTEMSTALMQDRYDAIMFSKLHKDGMNYSQFKRGKLPPKVEKEYFEFLEEELPSLEPLYIDTATGVMALEQRIKEVNPDIVFIDGVYLMEDDQNARDDWLRVTHITRDLKKLAKRVNKPIVINTQLDEKKSNTKAAPKLSDIKYSQAIAQDSDVVISLFRDEVMINDREMQVSVIKNREGEGGKITLNWDFTCMDFSEIYAELPSDSEGVDDSTDNDTLSVDDVE